MAIGDRPQAGLLWTPLHDDVAFAAHIGALCDRVAKLDAPLLDFIDRQICLDVETALLTVESETTTVVARGAHQQVKAAFSGSDVQRLLTKDGHPVLGSSKFRGQVPAIGDVRYGLIQIYRNHMATLKWHRDHFHKPGHEITIVLRLKSPRGLSTRRHGDEHNPKIMDLGHCELLSFGQDFNAWFEHAIEAPMAGGSEDAAYGLAVWCSLAPGSEEKDLYEQLDKIAKDFAEL